MLNISNSLVSHIMGKPAAFTVPMTEVPLASGVLGKA